MPVSDAKVTGSVEIKGDEISLASGSSVAAGERGAHLALTRGGELQVCANSAVHLAAGANPGEMMVSLDKGAVELHSKLGEFSDVVMTPDLRVLLSGPGEANVSIRVNQQGDTCVDNAVNSQGTNAAPYVTVSEQLGTGVYRVQAGQRVMLEHGSVSAVVDNEKEPCGCPPVPEMQLAKIAPAQIAPAEAAPAEAAHGQEFPLAQSEGLAPGPAAPTQPVVPPGEVHAQVTVPFVFNGSRDASPSSAAGPAAAATPVPAPSAPGSQLPATSSPPSATSSVRPSSASGPPDVWTAVKGFFHKLFGKK